MQDNPFYNNKERIEQAWKLLEVASDIIYGIVDETDSSIDSSFEIYKTIKGAEEALYEVYEENIQRFKV